MPAVLGHRLQENDVISLPLKIDQKVYPHVSCASVQRQQLKTMFEHFEEVTMKKYLNLFHNTALFPKNMYMFDKKLSFLTTLSRKFWSIIPVKVFFILLRFSVMNFF